MTLTDQKRAEMYRRFDAVLGERMERIFERAMLGEVTWDKDKWAALLDWIGGPLRRRMYRSWMEQNPNGRIEQSPAYAAFEAFDRGRIAGQLEDGNLVRVTFAAVFELQSLVSSALGAFDVEFGEGEA